MRIFLLPLLAITAPALAQYAGDNVRYTNITLEQLPATLKEHPDALILDVRSPGEFHDTSNYASLNIGRIKGAVNIPIDSITAQYADLLPYKDEPIVIYCSHSQRSRRVGSQLADSRFTQLSNLNAGLSRYWHEHDRLSVMNELVQRERSHELVSAVEMCALISNGAVVVDLRPDSACSSATASITQRALGVVRDALHIPFDQLEKRIAEFPRDRSVVLIDEDGTEAPRSAALLYGKGFQRVHVLFGGLNTLLDTDDGHFPCATKVLERSVPYKILPIDRVDIAAITAGRNTVLDIRTAAEFESKAERPWLNVGRLRDAINLPKDTLLKGGAKDRVPLDASILVMGRGNDSDHYEAAQSLCEQGFTNVTVLDGGIWHLRWVAHNMAGRTDLERLVEPPPAKVK